MHYIIFNNIITIYRRAASSILLLANRTTKCVFQTVKVSDHYPVEVELKSTARPGGADKDLLELKRGNLLLEREKLGLEIQILRLKKAKMNREGEL